MKKWQIAVIVLALGGIAALTTLEVSRHAPTNRDAQSRTKANQPVTVAVAAVHRAPWVDTLEAVGSLQAAETVELRSELTARLTHIAFAEGRPVKRGQVLLSFDDATARAQAAQAEAERELAASNLRRNQALVSQGYISARLVDEAKAALAVAEAKARLAQAELQKYTIRAPFDGVAGVRALSVGAVVQPGQELLRIDALDTLKVDFTLPERALPRLVLGQRLQVRADALPNAVFEAQVDVIDARINAAGRALALRARLDNRRGTLRPGMFVRVALTVDETPDALWMPETAVVPGTAGSQVYRVVEGQAQRIPVKLGARRDGEVRVLSGLSAGDTVVVAGHLRLTREVMPVRIAPPTVAPRAASA